MESEAVAMLTHAKPFVLKFVWDNHGYNPNSFMQRIRVGKQFPCALTLNDAQCEALLSSGTEQTPSKGSKIALSIIIGAGQAGYIITME